MKVTTPTGTKPLKLFPFTAIYILNIYSGMPVATCTGKPVASGTVTDPRFWQGAIQESEFMNSEAKLNTKNV